MIESRTQRRSISAALGCCLAAGLLLAFALPSSAQSKFFSVRGVDGQRRPDRVVAKAQAVPLSGIHKSAQLHQAAFLPPLDPGLLTEVKRQDEAESKLQRVRIGLGRPLD